MGYLPETVPLYPDMRVEEYLGFRSRLKGVPRALTKARVDQVCEAARVTDRRRQRISQLSRGYRQRVGIADALVAEPKVLLLDEPTVGLDPVEVRGFRDLLSRLSDGRAIVVSSHVLSEVQAIADRAIVLVDGRIVADGKPEQLHAHVGLDSSASFEEVFVALAGGV